MVLYLCSAVCAVTLDTAACSLMVAVRTEEQLQGAYNTQCSDETPECVVALFRSALTLFRLSLLRLLLVAPSSIFENYPSERICPPELAKPTDRTASGTASQIRSFSFQYGHHGCTSHLFASALVSSTVSYGGQPTWDDEGYPIYSRGDVPITYLVAVGRVHPDGHGCSGLGHLLRVVGSQATSVSSVVRGRA